MHEFLQITFYGVLKTVTIHVVILSAEIFTILVNLSFPFVLYRKHFSVLCMFIILASSLSAHFLFVWSIIVGTSYQGGECTSERPFCAPKSYFPCNLTPFEKRICSQLGLNLLGLKVPKKQK